jgi:hypothetical protein
MGRGERSCPKHSGGKSGCDGSLTTGMTVRENLRRNQAGEESAGCRGTTPHSAADRARGTQRGTRPSKLRKRNLSPLSSMRRWIARSFSGLWIFSRARLRGYVSHTDTLALLIRSVDSLSRFLSVASSVVSFCCLAPLPRLARPSRSAFVARPSCSLAMFFFRAFFGRAAQQGLSQRAFHRHSPNILLMPARPH